MLIKKLLISASISFGLLIGTVSVVELGSVNALAKVNNAKKTKMKNKMKNKMKKTEKPVKDNTTVEKETANKAEKVNNQVEEVKEESKEIIEDSEVIKE